jgi:hypothetical protein
MCFIADEHGAALRPMKNPHGFLHVVNESSSSPSGVKSAQRRKSGTCEGRAARDAWTRALEEMEASLKTSDDDGSNTNTNIKNDARVVWLEDELGDVRGKKSKGMGCGKELFVPTSTVSADAFMFGHSSEEEEKEEEKDAVIGGPFSSDTKKAPSTRRGEFTDARNGPDGTFGTVPRVGYATCEDVARIIQSRGCTALEALALMMYDA